MLYTAAGLGFTGPLISLLLPGHRMAVGLVGLGVPLPAHVVPGGQSAVRVGGKEAPLLASSSQARLSASGG